jgi:hypothetical protein
MMQEHIPAWQKGWYNDFVDPNLDIRDGFLHASNIPGLGTRLKAGVRDRADAIVRVSDTPGVSGIDAWGDAPQRLPETQALVDELEIEWGPKV